MNASSLRFNLRMAVRTLALLLSFLVLAGGGCGRPAARVALHQPFAPAAQQEIVLASDWAFSDVAGDARKLLLAFPLPGAQDGPRDFLLYLALPADEGRHAIKPTDAGGGRGFLVQRVGVLGGKTLLTRGYAECEPVKLGGGAWRVRLRARCEDGTLIDGVAIARRAPDEVEAFERAYAGDVGLLRAIGEVGQAERERGEGP